jgi:hypothetical protein
MKKFSTSLAIKETQIKTMLDPVGEGVGEIKGEFNYDIF